MSADCKRWTSQADTNVNDGQRNDASTLEACQAACVSNSQCTGVDWNPAATENQRCWLSGPWSGQKNVGTASGVTHWDLDRGCPGKIAIINI